MKQTDEAGSARLSRHFSVCLDCQAAVPLLLRRISFLLLFTVQTQLIEL